MNINLLTWYTCRELDYCPKHFIETKTEITDESLQWILERLEGRFYIQPSTGFEPLYTQKKFAYFENPEEAVMYELTWS